MSGFATGGWLSVVWFVRMSWTDRWIYVGYFVAEPMWWIIRLAISGDALFLMGSLDFGSSSWSKGSASGRWQDHQVRLSNDLKNNAHDPAALFAPLTSIVDVIFFVPTSSCRIAKRKRWTSVRVRASRNGACNGTISDIALSSR